MQPVSAIAKNPVSVVLPTGCLLRKSCAECRVCIRVAPHLRDNSISFHEGELVRLTAPYALPYAKAPVLEPMRDVLQQAG